MTRVASSDVHRLAVGDRVVAMGPGHFVTREQFPEWACQKLQDDEDLHVAATLPLVFSTALYALHHRARLQEGESVLIHSAAGGLGSAAIQIAQLSHADIFATVSTEEKRDYLVATFGLRRDHIFNSRDSSFLPAVLAATGGRGVDVVLNSLTGDLLHDSWRACAPWGRFVEVGKQDIVDAGRLDMEMFRRNVTFTAFDLSELSDQSQPRLNRIASRYVMSSDFRFPSPCPLMRANILLTSPPLAVCSRKPCLSIGRRRSRPSSPCESLTSPKLRRRTATSVLAIASARLPSLSRTVALSSRYVPITA